MFSMSSVLLAFAALIVHMASASNFEMASGPGTIRAEDRDPFKEGYFEMIVACFALVFFFVGCMFGVRVCLGKRRGNDSRSFFLVA